MFIRCIQAESKKIRRSLLLPACILIPVIPAVMGTFNYLQNLELLKSEWYSLWTQHTLFYASFFFAPLMGLYASYLWRLEHRHNNWNMVMTAPVPAAGLFFGKLAVLLLINSAHTALDGGSFSDQRQNGWTSRALSPFYPSLAAAGYYRRITYLLSPAFPFHEHTKFLYSYWYRSSWKRCRRLDQ